MATKLSDFRADMRCSKNLVYVTEEQLREYSIMCDGWRDLCKDKDKMIAFLEDRIKNLQAENEVLKIKHEVIDLRA